MLEIKDHNHDTRLNLKRKPGRKTKISQDTIRVTADFTVGAFKVLEEVSTKMGISKAEAMRRSLSMMKYFLQEQDKGRRFIVESEDSKDRSEIVSF